MSKLFVLGRSAVLALLGVGVGCSEDRTGARPPTPDEIPLLQSVNAGKAVVGLQLGTLREEREVRAFRATKRPISVRHYRQCVAAGACDRPGLDAIECRPGAPAGQLSGSTFDRADEEELPVTCVKPEQAANYCRWIGGKLPDSTEWLTAVRGPGVRRFPWGNEAPSCAQHPEGREGSEACDRATMARFRVGAHPAGAGPTGVEDVLLTPAELVATSRDSVFGVCGEGAKACLAKGLNAGAIDGFGPIHQPPQGSTEVPSIQLYGFRCVLEAK